MLSSLAVDVMNHGPSTVDASLDFRGNTNERPSKRGSNRTTVHRPILTLRIFVPNCPFSSYSCPSPVPVQTFLKLSRIKLRVDFDCFLPFPPISCDLHLSIAKEQRTRQKQQMADPEQSCGNKRCLLRFCRVRSNHAGTSGVFSAASDNWHWHSVRAACAATSTKVRVAPEERGAIVLLLLARSGRRRPSGTGGGVRGRLSATSSRGQDLPSSRLTALTSRREASAPGRVLFPASAAASPPRRGRPLSLTARLLRRHSRRHGRCLTEDRSRWAIGRRDRGGR